MTGEKLHKKSECSSRIYLSNDAVHEILLRLPKKSICRFRCVSKTWLSISSSPFFLRAHARNSPITFLLQNVRTESNPQINCYQIFPGTAGGSRCITTIRFSDEVLASCDGLLLVKRLLPHNPRMCYPWCQYYVLNPITGDRVSIGYPGFKFCERTVGFYFHRWTGEYRLLNLNEMKAPFYYLKAEVLSLGIAKHSWTPINVELPSAMFFRRNFPVLVNDCLHWIGFEIPQETQRRAILAFDIREETFSLNTMPLNGHTFDLGLVDVNGRLGCWMIRKYHPGEDDLTMELFVADDDGERKWEEMYSVCCGGVRRRWVPHMGLLNCVVRIREGKLLFLFMGMVIHLVEWDFKSGRYCAEEIFDQDSRNFIGLMYRESLISPSN